MSLDDAFEFAARQGVSVTLSLSLSSYVLALHVDTASDRILADTTYAPRSTPASVIATILMSRVRKTAAAASTASTQRLKAVAARG